MKVISSCPMRVESVVWQAASGVSVVTVAAKATFLLQPTESPLAGEQEEPNAADGYWDDDERRSLHVAGDLAPRKARADVILVGAAFAPRGQPVRSLITRMVVGDVDKSIEVFADRAFALDGALHEGSSFTKMPLTWERAAGGPHTSNPAGVRADAPPDSRGWTPLPNLQPPGLHVMSRGDFIAPVGYGPISPWWPGRQARLHRGLAGWDFRAWYEAPLPADLDDGFFNVAPPDQQTDAIRANERIVLENLLRDHPRLVTSLAPITPRVWIERTHGPAQELEMRCDTLSIDTDRGTCALTWRRQLLFEQEEVVKQVVVVTGPSPSIAPAPPVAKRAPPRPRAPSAVTDTLLPGKLVIAGLPFVKSAPPPADPPDSVTGTLLPGRLILSQLPFVTGRPPPPGPPPPQGSAGEDPSKPALPFRTPRAPLPSTAGRAAWGEDDEQTQPVRVADVPAAPATPWPGGHVAAPASPSHPFDPDLPETREVPAFRAPPEPPRPPPVHMPVIELPHPFESVRSSPSPSFDPLADVQPPKLAPPPPLAPAPEEAAPPSVDPPTDAPTEEPAPAMSEENQPPAPPPAPAQREVTIEQCGAITAAIAMNRPGTDKILEDEELTKERWQAESKRWDEAMRAEQERGKTTLRKKFDEAYVMSVEQRRGPITEAEYARLVVASERGALASVAGDLSLPRGAPMRIERVWLLKLMQDPALDRRARAAITAEREK